VVLWGGGSLLHVELVTEPRVVSLPAVPLLSFALRFLSFPANPLQFVPVPGAIHRLVEMGCSGPFEPLAYPRTVQTLQDTLENHAQPLSICIRKSESVIFFLTLREVVFENIETSTNTEPM
jgi:hypothetical protein